MTTEIRHVYNSSEADTSSRMGYGWRLSSQQELKESGIKDYPYVYADVKSISKSLKKRGSGSKMEP